MTITVARVPCGSCPYRRDVPSGIWAQSEYDKLPSYDNALWAQPPFLFMCHQRDGNLCAGWLACHGPRDLLALRLPQGDPIDPAVYSYRTSIPVFRSGEEARAHGGRDIKAPKARAKKMVAGLMQKMTKK